MMTSSNGNIFRVTGPLCGEFTGPGEFPTQRPVTRSFGVFFDLRLNKRLSKQLWGWWFETLSWSLWRHCNGTKTISMSFSNYFDRKTVFNFCYEHTKGPFTLTSSNTTWHHSLIMSFYFLCTIPIAVFTLRTFFVLRMPLALITSERGETITEARRQPAYCRPNTRPFWKRNNVTVNQWNKYPKGFHIMTWRYDMETICVFCPRGIRLPVDSRHKGTLMQSFDVSFVVSLNKLLNKESSSRDLWHLDGQVASW